MRLGIGLPNVAAGPDAGHYRVYPPGFAETIWTRTFRSKEQVRQAIDDYAAYGWDELILIPAVAELSQVEELARIAKT